MRRISFVNVCVVLMIVVLVVAATVAITNTIRNNAINTTLTIERNILAQDELVRREFDDIATTLLSCSDDISETMLVLKPTSSTDEQNSWRHVTDEDIDQVAQCQIDLKHCANLYDIQLLLKAAQDLYESVKHVRGTIEYLCFVDEDDYSFENLKGNLDYIAGLHATSSDEVPILTKYNLYVHDFNRLIEARRGQEIAKLLSLRPYSFFEEGYLAETHITYR
jgi:hypothetical protein